LQETCNIDAMSVQFSLLCFHAQCQY